MNQPKYTLKAEPDLMFFEFVSIGLKGRMPMLIQFTETNLNGFFNLGFGVKNNDTGKINDIIVTNNGDTEKVLATVVSAVYAFTDKYPDAWVYATGSTHARTRLYRMGINKYLNKVENDFYLFGEMADEWLSYEKDMNFEGYVVKRKIN